MISISRPMLLVIALLAPVASAVAQQNDSAMKSSKDATGYTKPTVTTPAGNSNMKGQPLAIRPTGLLLGRTTARSTLASLPGLQENNPNKRSSQ